MGLFPYVALNINKILRKCVEIVALFWKLEYNYIGDVKIW